MGTTIPLSEQYRYRVDCATDNAASLERELAWFSQLLDRRIALYFEQNTALKDIDELVPPNIRHDHSPYACFLRHYQLNADERLLLILALIPHIRPQLLDIFFTRNKDFDRGYSEFGGILGKFHSGFLPTGETAAFLLAGDNLPRRIKLLNLFSPEHRLFKAGILMLSPYEPGEPIFSAGLTVTTHSLHQLTMGEDDTPSYSSQFPASRITTPLTWEDLILNQDVMTEITNIVTWLKFSDDIMDRWQLRRHLKPGYRCLFYGPPGTGKTLTATLLGQETGMDVYRVDLSAMISKYIGDTEKNLASLFDQAQHRRWILFFDEAEALFGARSEGSSANDRHANQQVAYLLQRIEDFPGMVILATNLRDNMDEAFCRRFQSMVYFPLPDAQQRYALWQSMLGNHVENSPTLTLKDIAEKYEMAGGAMINAVRYAAICAQQMGNDVISTDLLTQGIIKERRKEGKIV